MLSCSPLVFSKPKKNECATFELSLLTDQLKIQSNTNPEDFAEKLKQYLDESGNINGKNPEGKTLLHIAVDSGNLHILQLLLDKGADINAQDSKKRSPLIAAVLGAISNNNSI